MNVTLLLRTSNATAYIIIRIFSYFFFTFPLEAIFRYSHYSTDTVTRKTKQKTQTHTNHTKSDNVTDTPQISHHAAPPHTKLAGELRQFRLYAKRAMNDSFKMVQDR